MPLIILRLKGQQQQQLNAFPESAKNQQRVKSSMCFIYDMIFNSVNKTTSKSKVWSGEKFLSFDLSYISKKIPSAIDQTSQLTFWGLL